MQGRRGPAEPHVAPEFSIPPASAALAATLPAAATRRIGPLAPAGFTVPPASAGETAHAPLAARAARTAAAPTRAGSAACAPTRAAVATGTSRPTALAALTAPPPAIAEAAPVVGAIPALGSAAVPSRRTHRKKY